ncbi:hypothetical protein PUN28_008322 [Cardiocondyla obscurior]
MAWVSIGKALKHPLSGSDAKHRWDTLRNLYSRARREILLLKQQQGRSGSGVDNVSYENLLTPQSLAIHQFMGHLYVARKTVSNYNKHTSSAPDSLSSSKNILPLRNLSKSLLTKRSRLSSSDSDKSTSLQDLSVDSPICKENLVTNILNNNKSIDSFASDNYTFRVPALDIKRKKTDVEIESVIKETLQSISAACSALPTFLKASSKAGTEEENLMSFLSLGFKRVPAEQKIRCMIQMLEVLESFQQK